MKTFATITALSAASLAIAAPATLQKRIPLFITVFNDVNYGGSSYGYSLDLDGPLCVANVLRNWVYEQGSSVQLRAESGGISCQLIAANYCNTAEGDATEFFNTDIPDLSHPAYNFDNRAKSIFCKPDP